MNIKYPDVHIHLVGEDGNAYSILGRLQKALRRAEIPKDEIEAVMADATSGDYNHLLRTVMATVETD